MWKIKKYSKIIPALLAIYIIINIPVAVRYPMEYTLYWVVLLSGYVAVEMLGTKCISIYIFCFAAYIMGIFQPIDSILHSDIYSDTMRITLNILLDEETRIQYMFFLSGSYIFMYLIIGCILSKKQIRIGSYQKWKNINKSFLHVRLYASPIITAFIFSVFRYAFQRHFSILIPGCVATIPFVAVWVYLIRILSLYVWTIGFNYYLSKVHDFKSFLVKSLLFMLACCIPEILIGNRSSLIIYMAQGIIAFLIYSKKYIEKIGKEIMLAGMILALFAGLSIVLSNFMRTGDMSSLFRFLRIRVVGIVDGLVVIHHLDSEGITLRFAEYFLSLFGYDNAQALASFYTHDVIGYPSELLHNYALPGFISGTLYLGTIGVLFSSAIISFICGFCEKKCQISLHRRKKKDANIIIIYTYVYNNVIFSLLFEGNIDKMLFFMIPAICVFTIINFIKVEFGIKSGKEHVTHECPVSSAV